MKRKSKHFYITCLLGLICICQIYIICVLCLICGGRIFHFKSQTIPDTGSAETNAEASESDEGNTDQEIKMTEEDSYEQWDPKKETDFLITGFLVGGDGARKTFHLDTNETIYVTDQIMMTEHTDFLIYNDPDLKSPVACSYEEFLEDWNEDTPYEIRVEAYSEENACWTADRVAEMSQRDWMNDQWFLVTGFLIGGDRARKTFHLDTNETMYVTDQITMTESTQFLIYSDPDLKSPVACSYEEFLEDWNADTPYEIQAGAYSEENACWTAYRVTEMSQRDWMWEKLEEGLLGYCYYDVRRTEEDGMLEMTPIELLSGWSEETKTRMRELYVEGRIDTPNPYYESIYTVEYPELKQTAAVTENTRFYVLEYDPYPYTSRYTEEEFFDSQFYEGGLFRVIVKDGQVECIVLILLDA